MLEIIIGKAKEEIYIAISYVMKIKSTKNKAEYLNIEYHMRKFSAFMDIIEDLSIEKFIEIEESTKDMRQFILEKIVADKI